MLYEWFKGGLTGSVVSHHHNIGARILHMKMYIDVVLYKEDYPSVYQQLKELKKITEQAFEEIDKGIESAEVYIFIGAKAVQAVAAIESIQDPDLKRHFYKHREMWSEIEIITMLAINDIVKGKNNEQI